MDARQNVANRINQKEEIRVRLETCTYIDCFLIGETGRLAIQPTFLPEEMGSEVTFSTTKAKEQGKKGCVWAEAPKKQIRPLPGWNSRIGLSF